MGYEIDWRQRRWLLFQRWVAPPVGFALAGAALLTTGRTELYMLAVDLPLVFAVGYVLMFLMLTTKAQIGGYGRQQYSAELRNFLVPGEHCFGWTTGLIIEWAIPMLILKWCAFHFCVEWLGSNPWSPRAGGLGGAATGAVLGLVFGVLYAVWNSVRGRGKEDAEPGAAADRGRM